jgi:RNA recognition motif-containing protein
MSYNVNVSNLSPSTTQKSLEDFFSFCGKISSIDFNNESKSAIIHFEKPSAVKTALMLDGGSLDDAHISVSSSVDHPEESNASEPHVEGAHVDQADKPRAAIVAEYLAKGYVLSDQVLQKAIDLDQKQGISARFMAWWHSFDHAVGAKVAPAGTEQPTLSSTVTGHVNTGLGKAREIDQQRGISNKATEYYQVALGSSFGQKVREFYTTTSKQVVDIHEEAKRIASTQTPAQSAAPTAATNDPTITATAPATNAPTVV